MHEIAELPAPGGVAPAAAVDDRASALSDAELARVRAAREGDRASMEAIYAAEAPRLVRRLRHLSGSLALAQDLTHDAFVVAFCGRAPFEGTAAVSTWLYGIARNKWLNHRRKQRRRRLALAAAVASTSSAPGLAASDASEGVALDELEQRLDAALAELPARLREAFVLRVIEQLPLREAARLAGVAESTMSKRASAAERRVRAAIESPESEQQS